MKVWLLLLILVGLYICVSIIRRRQHKHTWKYFANKEKHTLTWFYCPRCMSRMRTKIINGKVELREYKMSRGRKNGTTR